MLPADAARVRALQERIDVLRGIIDATAREDVRGVLLEMLADGERALAGLTEPRA
jgi:hypothetical protein